MHSRGSPVAPSRYGRCPLGHTPSANPTIALHLLLPQTPVPTLLSGTAADGAGVEDVPGAGEARWARVHGPDIARPH